MYGVPESGNHWYDTYIRHLLEKLKLQQSTYDPCLMYTHKGITDRSDYRGVVALQVDDSLFIRDKELIETEDSELKKAGIDVKPVEELLVRQDLGFNRGNISREEDSSVYFRNLTKQVKNLNLVSSTPQDLTCSRGTVKKNVNQKGQYSAIRALATYLATVCQPEAAFDLSYATQITNPTDKDVKFLNQRIQWQKDNVTRGLRFVQLGKGL
jgi:hypothetical protein